MQGNLHNWNGVIYTFDYGNRLRTIAGLESYRYDAWGRRVLATGAAGAIASLYGKDGQLLFQSDARSGKRRQYVYLGGSLVAEHDRPLVGSTVTVTYQHTDALGSPVATTNSAKSVLQRSEYEPYGKVLNRALEDGPGFAGHVQDADTSLVYMQQRYYDPRTGRFWSTDPVTVSSAGGNFNRYWYANDNPYKFTDPDGRESVGEMIDTAAEGCGSLSCAGWAVAKGAWSVFGAEGVSQVYDKGAGATTGDKIMAGIEVGTLGLGGKVGAGIRAIEGAAKWLSPVGRMSRQIAREFGVAGGAAKNGSGAVFKLADGKVTVRVMESGGGRTNYLRVSVEGKGSVDATGALSSDKAATHIPIGKNSLKLIQKVVERYTQ